MSAIPHHYWDGINHPYKMLDKHYCEGSWNLVKENKVSVWGSFEPVEIGEEIDWGINPLNDETWSFYFNGLSWLYSHLWAIDYLNEKPDVMFKIIKQYHRHIFSENPNKMVWFDHATSDRLSILSVVSLHPCILLADENTRNIIDEMLSIHIEKIIEFKDSRKWINSNHGVFHSLALLNSSLVRSVTDSGSDIKNQGVEYLSDTLSTILSKNEHISLEQSAYYHQLAISLIESLEPVQLSELKIDKMYFIQKMRDSNHWLTCTDKKLIAIGDTSVISNISPKHYPINQPKQFAKTFFESGISFSKYKAMDGWNHFSFLHREKRAPHGHFDALSITLSKGSKEFIIDSGGPYRYGDALRFSYFMSSYAHNVATINGQRHESGAVLIDSELISENIFAVEAEHSGYFPVKHTRKCVYVKNKGLIVFDSLSNIDSPTMVQLLWHIHPDCIVNEDYTEIVNDDQIVWIRNNVDVDKTIVSGIEGDSPQGWITPGIGVKQPCPTLIDSIEIDKDTTIITYFEYEKNCFETLDELSEIDKWQAKNDSKPILPFGFNEPTIAKYISNDPMFWQPGTYFGDRNIWKINKSQQKLKKLKLSVTERSELIKKAIGKRLSSNVPTIYIISNGGSGCHYLGGLISMKNGFKLIDEVYFPPIIIDNITTLDAPSANGLVEMVNYVHLGDLQNSDLTIPINTMHLRQDVPLTKIKSSSNSIFITLIRNPIDVAISRGLRKSEYKTMNKENSDIPVNEYLEKQAKRTMNHFRRLKIKQNDVDSLYIKFEDLISQPKDTLKTVFTHIGQDITESEIDLILDKYEKNNDLTKNKNVSKKPELTAEQKEILLTFLSETCNDLGYNIPDYLK